jgi:hypothetical protein
MRSQKSLYAFSNDPWLRLQGVATDPDLDVATILAPGAKMVDFTGYSVGSAGATATLARIRLPGQTGEPFWTLTTPRGLSTRIDSSPLHQEITTHANRVTGRW